MGCDFEMIYGYVRVSTKEQNEQRQVEALTKYGVEEKYIKIDKASSKNFNREKYQLLKNEILRAGDTLVIKELDRLGRDMEQIKQEWRALEEAGINLIVLDNPILNTEGKTDLEKKLISNIVFELLSYMAEKERQKIRQRQAEGIKIAQEQGKKFGRPRAEYPSNWEEIYNSWKEKNITAVVAMEKLNLKKNTFYKLVKEYEN